MRIIIDTNVVISAVFFGGIPRRIIEAVMERKFRACGTAPIIEEYEDGCFQAKFSLCQI